MKEKTVKTGNYAVEHSPCQADSSSASQEFRILWNPTFHYCPALSHMNPIHTPPACCFTVNFIVILSGTSRNPSPQYLTSLRGGGGYCTQVLQRDCNGLSGEGRYNGYPTLPSTCCCVADFDIHRIVTTIALLQSGPFSRFRMLRPRTFTQNPYIGCSFLPEMLLSRTHTHDR